MCIKEIDEDITDEEIERIYGPFNDNLNDYMIKFIIPNVIAHQMSSAYDRKCLGNGTLLQHYNSMRDIFNIFPKLDEVKPALVEILMIKYNLQIINENTLEFKKWPFTFERLQ